MDIKIYEPIKMLPELRKCNTPAKCLNSNTPILAVMKKEIGEDKVLAILEMWIIDINEFININNKMKPNQVIETAMMLLQDFYYFKIADINLIFTKAKKGKFGNLYGVIDGSKIYQWFEQHDNERAKECYMEHLEKHDIIKASERV